MLPDNLSKIFLNNSLRFSSQLSFHSRSITLFPLQSKLFILTLFTACFLLFPKEVKADTCIGSETDSWTKYSCEADQINGGQICVPHYLTDTFSCSMIMGVCQHYHHQNGSCDVNFGTCNLSGPGELIVTSRSGCSRLYSNGGSCSSGGECESGTCCGGTCVATQCYGDQTGISCTSGDGGVCGSKTRLCSSGCWNGYDTSGCSGYPTEYYCSGGARQSRPASTCTANNTDNECDGDVGGIACNESGGLVCGYKTHTCSNGCWSGYNTSGCSVKPTESYCNGSTCSSRTAFTCTATNTCSDNCDCGMNDRTIACTSLGSQWCSGTATRGCSNGTYGEWDTSGGKCTGHPSRNECSGESCITVEKACGSWSNLCADGPIGQNQCCMAAGEVAPGAPSGGSPNGVTNIGAPVVTLSWTNPSWGRNCPSTSRYIELYYCTGTSCSPGTNITSIDQTTPNTSHNWTLPITTHGTVYRWMAIAWNEYQRTSSAIWQFTVESNPPTCDSLTASPDPLKNGAEVTVTSSFTDVESNMSSVENYVCPHADGTTCASNEWVVFPSCSSSGFGTAKTATRTCTWTPGSGGNGNSGLHYVIANGQDMAGNSRNQTNSSCSRTLCIDKDLPTASCPSTPITVANGVAGSGSNLPRGGAASTFTFNWNGADTPVCSGVRATYPYWYRVDSSTNPGASTSTCDQNGDSTYNGSCWIGTNTVGFTSTRTKALTDGVHTAYGWVRDKADQVSTTNCSADFCVDTVGPTDIVFDTLTCDDFTGRASDTPACSNNSIPTVTYQVQRTSPISQYNNQYWTGGTGWTSNSSDPAINRSAVAGANFNGTMPGSTLFANCPGATCTYKVRVKANDGLQDGSFSSWTTVVPSCGVEEPLCNSVTFSGTIHPSEGIASVPPGRPSRATINISNGSGATTYDFGTSNWNNVDYNSNPPPPQNGLSVNYLDFTQTAYLATGVGRGGQQIVLNGNKIHDSSFTVDCPAGGFIQQGVDITSNPSTQTIGPGGSVSYAVGLASDLWEGGLFDMGVDEITPSLSGGPDDIITCTIPLKTALYSAGRTMTCDVGKNVPYGTYLVNFQASEKDTNYYEYGSVELVVDPVPCRISSGTNLVYPGQTSSLEETHHYPINTWTQSCGSFLSGGMLYSSITPGYSAEWMSKSFPSGEMIPGASCTVTVNSTTSGGSVGFCSEVINVHDFTLNATSPPDPVCVGNNTAWIPISISTTTGWSWSVDLSSTCPSGATCEFYATDKTTRITSLWAGAGRTNGYLKASNIPSGTSTISITAREPNYGYSPIPPTNVSVTAAVCPFTCTVTANPDSVVSGGVSTLTTAVNPVNPPSGISPTPYDFQWRALSTGSYVVSPSNWTEISPPNTATAYWRAKAGSSFIGDGGSGNPVVDVTDGGSGATAFCGDSINVNEVFTLNLTAIGNTNVCKGQDTSFTVASVLPTPPTGWSGTIQLSVDTFPTGATWTFNPSSTIIAGQSSTLIVDTSALGEGSHSITVKGTVIGATNSSVDYFKTAAAAFSVLTPGVPPCDVSCKLSPSSVLSYPGETTNLIPTPSPLTPPSNGSYCFDCTDTLPSMGSTANTPDSSCGNICEWTAPQFVGGASGISITDKITDVDSGATNTCQSVGQQADFALGTADSPLQMAPTQTKSATFYLTKLEGWDRNVNLSVSSCPSGVGISCGIPNPGTVKPNNSPASSFTLSVSTSNASAGCHDVIVKAEDAASTLIPKWNKTYTLQVCVSTTPCVIDQQNWTVLLGGSKQFTANNNSTDYTYDWRSGICPIASPINSPSCGGSMSPLNSSPSTYSAPATLPERYGCVITAMCTSKSTGASECANTVGDVVAPLPTATAVPTSTPTPTSPPVQCNQLQPPDPLSLQVSNIGLTTATVSWAAVPAYKYRFEYKTSAEATWHRFPLSDTINTSVNLSGLACNTTYNFHVAARADCLDGSGNEVWSNWSTGNFSTVICLTCFIDKAIGTIAPGQSILATISASLSNYNVVSWFPRPGIGYFSPDPEPPIGPKLNNTRWYCESGHEGVAQYTATIEDTLSTTQVECAGASITCETPPPPTLCCAAVAHTCYICDPMDPTDIPSGNCIDQDTHETKHVNDWCGTGGGGLGTRLEMESISPPSCIGSTGGTCTFIARAKGTFPFDFKFGARTSRNLSSSPPSNRLEIDNLGVNWFASDMGYEMLPQNYNNGFINGSYDQSLTFKLPDRSRYLSQFKALVFPIMQLDSNDVAVYNDGDVMVALFEAGDRTKILAETTAHIDGGVRNGGGLGPEGLVGVIPPANFTKNYSNAYYFHQWSHPDNWVTFSFPIEPLIEQGKEYIISMREKTGDGTKKFGWANHTLGWSNTLGRMDRRMTKEFIFREYRNDQIGGFLTGGPDSNLDTSYVPDGSTVIHRCVDSQGDKVDGYYHKTCTVTFKLPDSIPTTDIKIGVEVQLTSQRKYDCNLVTDGCWMGYYSAGGSVLGSVSVTNQPWWQVSNGGDVYGKSGVSSRVPSSNYLMTGIPGVVRSDVSINTYNGNICAVGNYSMINSMTVPWEFTYFTNKLKSKYEQPISTDTTTRNWDGRINPTTGAPGPMSGGNKVVYIPGDLILGATSAITYYGNYTGIVVVERDLEIKKNVTIGGPSALMFVVKGDIKIDPSVSTIDGLYFTEGEFDTGTRFPTTDTSLTGNGAWYVSEDASNINLRRKNASGPAEIVNFEPKYLLKLMDYLGENNYVWQEVPG